MLNISRLGSLIASSVMVAATLRSAVLTSVSKPSPVPSGGGGDDRPEIE